MHEIEIKAAVRAKEALLAKLSELGCAFSDPVIQDDTVYVKNVGSVETFVANSAFLRIRVQGDGKVIFTVKHHEGRDANDPTGVPMEYEMEISSRDTMAQALIALGFKEAVRVTKTRRKCAYKDWEICLDEVEGLGTFIELERMAALEEAEAAQKGMIGLLLSLGVKEEDMPAQRYDIALLSK